MAELRIIDSKHRQSFAETFALQDKLVAKRLLDRSRPDTLILVEHEAVYTVGRSEPFQMPLDLPEDIPWVETNRGGQATYHGPGQLVAYPIFDLEKHGKDVHLFLRKLEEAIIHCLKTLNVDAFKRQGNTGVWVNTLNGEIKKIASLGVGVRRWVSYHGVALNINPDLRYFKAISACGEDGLNITSISEYCAERNSNVPSDIEVRRALVKAFAEIFSLDILQPEFAITPRKPSWLKVKAPGSTPYLQTQGIVRGLQLVTVCEEARCPNIGECWAHHTATFMIMGELCTRRCGFCSVKDGTTENLKPLDTFEPLRVAQAVQRLGLKHVVITSVNRDDLADMGAMHFHQTVLSLTHLVPECKIELLIPDLRGSRSLLETILQSRKIHVLNHNVETVPRLYRKVRPGAQFRRSLDILRWAKEISPEIKTKSGLMVGLGEEEDEVLLLMDELRDVGCDILTIGQYLQPGKEQLAVERYVHPDEFSKYQYEGLKRGFSHVESAPFVRSSYHAWKHSSGSSSPAHTGEAFQWL